MRAQPWLLTIVLGVTALIALGDAVLTRPRPQAAKSIVPKKPDTIGLATSRDGDGLRLEWNRNAAMVRRATHGLLYIEDGRYQSQFSLSDQQLTDSAIHYWPETENVRFRLELYHGSESTAEEVRVAAERSAPVVHTASVQAASGTVVERARPSPFERTRPEVVRRPMTPPAVSAKVEPKKPEPRLDSPGPGSPPVHVVERRRKGFLSRIPLLRRLKKQPQTADSQLVDYRQSPR